MSLIIVVAETFHRIQNPYTDGFPYTDRKPSVCSMNADVLND